MRTQCSCTHSYSKHCHTQHGYGPHLQEASQGHPLLFVDCRDHDCEHIKPEYLRRKICTKSIHQALCNRCHRRHVPHKYPAPHRRPKTRQKQVLQIVVGAQRSIATQYTSSEVTALRNIFLTDLKCPPTPLRYPGCQKTRPGRVQLRLEDRRRR